MGVALRYFSRNILHPNLLHILMKGLKYWAAKQILKVEKKPQELKDLVYQFVDSKGVKYYSWESMAKVPTNRVNELIGASMWSDAKISPDTLQEIADQISDLNMEIVKGGERKEINQKHARITALCNEIGTRKDYTIPSDVMIGMSAMIVVREDENPNEISERIQVEKMQQFKEDKLKGHTFFLKSTILNQLFPHLIGTSKKETALLHKWTQDERLQKERLKTILSNEKSKSSTKKKEK